MRMAGASEFTAGAARITVQSDGSFAWTRRVNAEREFTVYVAWADVKSNEVTWLKVGWFLSGVVRTVHRGSAGPSLLCAEGRLLLA